MELNLKIETKSKPEPIVTRVSIPVSVSVKEKLDEMKARKIDVNKILRDVLDQLIKKVV
jgi:hypothetical protein